MCEAADPLKGSIYIRDSAICTWMISWQVGSHIAGHLLRIDSALCKNRCITMASGWGGCGKGVETSVYPRDTSQRGLLQYYVLKFIIEQLAHGEKPLRLMIQASAGTGKSFLLRSISLWVALNGMKIKVCAPTGVRHLQTGHIRYLLGLIANSVEDQETDATYSIIDVI